MMVGLLMAFTEIAGQKPSFTLLPSTHHRIHPEAIVDTSFFYDAQTSIVNGNSDRPLTSPSGNLTRKEIHEKESKKPGLHIDSLFQKPVFRNERPGRRYGNYPLIIRYINPINIFFQITTLKK